MAAALPPALTIPEFGGISSASPAHTALSVIADVDGDARSGSH